MLWIFRTPFLGLSENWAPASFASSGPARLHCEMMWENIHFCQLISVETDRMDDNQPLARSDDDGERAWEESEIRRLAMAMITMRCLFLGEI